MILVPIKDLRGAKQRLSPVLSPEERTQLARTMAEDVFDALIPFALSPGVAVVSGDSWASLQAKRRNFTVILDDAQAGETAAIEVATSYCVNDGNDFSLVFPADIPLITSEEVQIVLDLIPPRGCVVVPAGDGRGTNGILRRPADLIPLRFGNDSLLPHLAAARATGYEPVVRPLPGIALDVDRPDDLALLLALPVCSRAQRLLLDWQIPARLEEIAHA
ncbi:MAG TPA: 2-phospho-L-lactate guanylyltransferase [Terriglobales bacterium]|nr:2-phospho-L-lactate guanylyltransferase [Terriglobales bacterium]